MALNAVAVRAKKGGHGDEESMRLDGQYQYCKCSFSWSLSISIQIVLVVCI